MLECTTRREVDLSLYVSDSRCFAVRSDIEGGAVFGISHFPVSAANLELLRSAKHIRFLGRLPHMLVLQEILPEVRVVTMEDCDAEAVSTLIMLADCLESLTLIRCDMPASLPDRTLNQLHIVQCTGTAAHNGLSPSVLTLAVPMIESLNETFLNRARFLFLVGGMIGWESGLPPHSLLEPRMIQEMFPLRKNSKVHLQSLVFESRALESVLSSQIDGLALHDCHFIDAFGLPFECEPNPFLTDLSFGVSGLLPKQICSIFRLLPGLTTIGLSGQNITQETWSALAGLQALTNLDVSWQNFMSECTAILPNVKNLTLSERERTMEAEFAVAFPNADIQFVENA